MKEASIIATCGVLASAAMLGLGVTLGGQSAGAATEASATPDRAAIERIVRDYLVANPEVMLEVQEAFEARQQEQQSSQRKEAISTYADEIFNSSWDGVIGNPEGSITIVEFFDYNCGYCRGALADMRALVNANPEVRFVLKEFPILGADSQKAHIVSMAFHTLYPEKYAEFHQALLGRKGRADEASAIEIARGLGADEAALRAAMARNDIVEAIERNYSLAGVLSITGTPSYVIGKEVVFGAVGQKTLQEKLALLSN